MKMSNRKTIAQMIEYNVKKNFIMLPDNLPNQSKVLHRMNVDGSVSFATIENIHQFANWCSNLTIEEGQKECSKCDYYRCNPETNNMPICILALGESTQSNYGKDCNSFYNEKLTFDF